MIPPWFIVWRFYLHGADSWTKLDVERAGGYEPIFSSEVPIMLCAKNYSLPPVAAWDFSIEWTIRLRHVPWNKSDLLQNNIT